MESPVWSSPGADRRQEADQIPEPKLMTLKGARSSPVLPWWPGNAQDRRSSPRFRRRPAKSGTGASVPTQAAYRMAPLQIMSRRPTAGGLEEGRGFLGRANCAMQPVCRSVFWPAKLEEGSNEGENGSSRLRGDRAAIG